MANKALFGSGRGVLAPKTDTFNEAGGRAYGFDATHALAQYAATGCINATFYASAEEQLDTVLSLCGRVDSEFIAKLAVFARERGYMKDMPAILLAVLSSRDPQLFAKAFDRVIDNAKMLRNFVQIMRSGVTGRKSLGSLPKRMIRRWFDARTDTQLFVGSIGKSPSLADVIKMAHPKPTGASREALYGYLIGRAHDAEALPDLVKHYEKFKRNTNAGKVDVPDVPMQMLTALNLTVKDWIDVARHASWQTTRMNLNTFARHGVFEKREMVGVVANRLRNREAIARSRVMPYQLMVAYLNTATGIPKAVTNALQDAMEIAIENVPKVDGRVVVCPDVSGSMQSPVTGFRTGATSKVRCVDVAALFAAAVLRRNDTAEVVPFAEKVRGVRLNPRDSVMTNAERLTRQPPGGTDCSAPLAELNRRKARAEMVIYVSDNESWMDSPLHGRTAGSTATRTMKEWSAFKKRNPKAKLVCIDIQPYGSTQAKERPDVINVGGFSDQVFRFIADVAQGATEQGHWVNQVRSVTL
ncbi:MAG: TROVE domain-containing protein [Phycisphaera sp.]|nr:TROVE domain-containing protein [Phycisphaera sp.]